MYKILVVLLSIVLCSAVDAKGGKGHGHTGHSVKGSGHFSGTGSNAKSHGVRGYNRKNGTYVAPHRSTNPNSTQRDNYAARGNYNPSNGRTGNSYVTR
jgi:hypothetical protein